MLPYACQNDYLLYWQQGKKTKRDDGKNQIFSKIPMITDSSSTLCLNVQLRTTGRNPRCGLFGLHDGQ